MRWVTVGGRDSAPLSRLRRQLGRNYRRATARSLPARLPARLRLQTVHRTVSLSLLASQASAFAPISGPNPHCLYKNKNQSQK